MGRRIADHLRYGPLSSTERIGNVVVAARVGASVAHPTLMRCMVQERCIRPWERAITAQISSA